MTSKMSSQQKRLQVAIVGCGRVASKHRKALEHLSEHLQLAALVDARMESARALLKGSSLQLHNDALFESLEELLASNIAVDIVAITTPSGSHFALAKEALLAGKHLLIEKPMTLNLREAEELMQLADEKNLRVALGHIYRYFPLVDLIRNDIIQEVYGEVRTAEVKVHWGHEQEYYDQAAWRGTWAQDGGALMNQSIHALDLMVWLLDLKTKSVQGNIARFARDIEAEDYGCGLYTLENGAILYLEGTTLTPEDAHEASFFIRLEDAEIEAGLKKGKPYIRAYDREGKKVGKYYSRFLRQLWKEGPIRSIKSFLNPHTRIYQDLLDAILLSKDAKADALDGYQSVENILALYKSAHDNGNAVSIPYIEEFTLSDMDNFFDEQLQL